LTIDKLGPAQTTVGREEVFYVTLENTGETMLSNLQIIDSYEAELRPVAASPPAASIDQNRVTWYLSQLEPGQKLSYQVTCQVVFDKPRTCSELLVRAAGGVERADQHCVRVDPAPGGGFPPGAGANALPPRLLPGSYSGGEPASPQTGSPESVTQNTSLEPGQGLQLTIDGRGDRWQVGDRIDYLIVIRNADADADSNVKLTVRLSPALKLQSYSGPVNAATSSPDWRTLRMLPLRTLRAAETVEFHVVATVTQPGDLVARAELTSQRSAASIAQEDTSVAVP
jgi:hypothetical protein